VEKIVDFLAFFEKNDPLPEMIQKILFERHHRDSDRRVLCKCRKIWPTGSR